MFTGADLLVKALAKHGVQHLFGMPGSHSTPIYDALQRSQSIATILIRNEQAGAFAADGYARVTGRPGLICTTAGPGATNALTGVAECWADSVPILLVAGQVNSDRMHLETGAYHEIDLDAIFKPVTKWYGTARRVDEIPELVGRAFEAMSFGRPRPAALFIPQDLQRVEASDVSIPSLVSPPAPVISDEAIAQAAALLAGAERPILLAGGGALWSGAEREVYALAEHLDMPVITSLNGKGIVDERNRRSLGHARSPRAKKALAYADAMLAVGCRFTEVMTEWRTMRVPDRLVQIDLDADQIGMNYPVDVAIVGDAKGALQALLGALSLARSAKWGKYWDEARSATIERPEWLIDTLRAELSSDTPVFCDACEMGYRLQTDWPSHAPRRFFYPSNYITLGWGFPAALGAAVALKDQPVVAVCGDGGFLMTTQEMATAVRYQLRVIVLVHNDSAYGAIKNHQRRSHGERYLDVDLNNPSLPRLAEAYGIPAITAAKPDDLRRALREALARSGPSLIEVPDEWRNLRG